MKRILALILIAVLLCCAAGCGSVNTTSTTTTTTTTTDENGVSHTVTTTETNNNGVVTTTTEETTSGGPEEQGNGTVAQSCGELAADGQIHQLDFYMETASQRVFTGMYFVPAGTEDLQNATEVLSTLKLNTWDLNNPRLPLTFTYDADHLVWDFHLVTEEETFSMRNIDFTNGNAAGGFTFYVSDGEDGGLVFSVS